jgi:uncharacterized protein with NAD-binding domain and iron-sulfur cluster
MVLGKANAGHPTEVPGAAHEEGAARVPKGAAAPRTGSVASDAPPKTGRGKRRPTQPTPPSPGTAPGDSLVRVAIVGGGCAGLAAAWELSRCPGYEVQVFEQSYRLGGKGASGRDEYGRIHEHGLHVWLGFYENAFRMMRECYDEVAANDWGPHRSSGEQRLAHATLKDAFFAEPSIGVGGHDLDSVFTVWSGLLPPAKGLPGEPLDVQTNPYTLASYLLRSLDLVKTLLMSSVASPSRGVAPVEQLNDPATAEELVAVISRWLQAGALTSVAAALQAMTLIERWVRHVDASRKRTGQVLKVLVAVASLMRKTLSELASCDEKLRWKTEMVDIVLAISVGLLRDRVLFRRSGFDAINHLDYRDWLSRHGATRAALDSRFIAGIYELVFAFEDGDPKRPAFAAGVALRSALRMFFTYRGAMFWRMRSGMGDAVIAPLYKAMLDPSKPGKGLRERSKVRFHLMHRLSRVGLTKARDGRLYVTALDFATTGDPERLQAVNHAALDHFGCWPNDDTHLARLAGTAKGKSEKRIGEHFDAVIFALGVDDFIAVLRGKRQGDRGLFEQLPERWSRMAEKSRTVATQAAQVWLNADFKSLGWQSGPGIITALDLASFETWADMTHTLASERAWRRTKGGDFDAALEGARAVAYLCSTLSDAEIAQNRGNAGKLAGQSLLKFLERDARAVWPRAFDGGLTAMDRVSHPGGPFVRDLVEQYARANAAGSDRYTLSSPGSIAARISPLDASVANMTIAGDWTACGLDAGCVEAAVMSGKLAAHAISGGTPSLSSIVGYDHP